MNIENVFSCLENLEKDVNISSIEFVDDDYSCKEIIKDVSQLKCSITKELMQFSYDAIDNIKLQIDSIKENLHILKVLTDKNTTRFLIETK
jgi:hypothetical protein